jgi:hypothetical protein
MAKKGKPREAGSFIYPDGTESAIELHEQMLADFDDSEHVKETRKYFEALGLPKKDLDILFPE